MSGKKRPVMDLPRQHLDLKGECKNGSGCSNKIFDANWRSHQVAFSLFQSKHRVYPAEDLQSINATKERAESSK